MLLYITAMAVGGFVVGIVAGCCIGITKMIYKAIVK